MKMKPCPFCGSTDLDVSSDYVHCNECTAFGPTAVLPQGVKSHTAEAEKAMINDWNKRIDDAKSCSKQGEAQSTKRDRVARLITSILDEMDDARNDVVAAALDAYYEE